MWMSHSPLTWFTVCCLLNRSREFFMQYSQLNVIHNYGNIWNCFSLNMKLGEIYINNCPMRCNTKQSIYYSAGSLYMFRVSTTPIIRSTQNCNYSLRYWLYFLWSHLPPTWPSLVTEGGGCTKNMTNTGSCSYSFVYWWWVWLTAETRRVNLQNNK